MTVDVGCLSWKGQWALEALKRDLSSLWAGAGSALGICGGGVQWLEG